MVLLRAPGALEAEAFAENAAILVEGEYGMPCALGVGKWQNSVAEFPKSILQAEDALRHSAGAAQGRLVKMALEIIRTRYQSDISVAAISEELHVSTNYFSRLFKQEMGEGSTSTSPGRASGRRRNCSRTANCAAMRSRRPSAIGMPITSRFHSKNTGVSPEQYPGFSSQRTVAADRASV